MVVLLVVAWAIAAIGVAIRMLWLTRRRVCRRRLPGRRLADRPRPPAYTAALTGAELALLAVGGGLYTDRRRDLRVEATQPWPAVFGYHEVFHTLVIAAALAHWFAVYLLAG